MNSQGITALLPRGTDPHLQLQDQLYGHNRWAVLLVFQSMDAGGRRHRCQVVSFKAPSAEELDHDFLWRSLRAQARGGRFGLADRPFCEDVLVVKMSPELLDAGKVPSVLIGRHIWDERYEDIRAMERCLARSGLEIRPLFFQVATGGRKRRLLERLNAPETYRKFDLADLETRDRWDDYMGAYEEAIRGAAGESEAADGPPGLVEALEKWFTRLVVAAVVVDALQSRGLDARIDATTLARSGM
jgi:polyphosphate kinase 2 (PPK2 family)